MQEKNPVSHISHRMSSEAPYLASCAGDGWKELLRGFIILTSRYYTLLVDFNSQNLEKKNIPVNIIWFQFSVTDIESTDRSKVRSIHSLTGGGCF